MSLGSRVMAQAGAGEILVSQTVKDLMTGSGLQFIDRGQVSLKGVPGDWTLYALERTPLDASARGTAIAFPSSDTPGYASAKAAPRRPRRTAR